VRILIIKTEFPEYIEVTRAIDEQLAWVNLDIRKTHGIPFCKGGVIFIDQELGGDYDWWVSELIHEAGHLVWDPCCFLNAVEAIAAIAASLPEKTCQQHMQLGNIASDLICEFRCAKNPMLSKMRAKGIDKIFTEATKKGQLTPVKAELLSIYSRLHPTAFKLKSSLFKEVKETLNKFALRNDRYVRIAKLFEPLYDEETAKKDSSLKSLLFGYDMDGLPIRPVNSDVEQAIEKVLKMAHDVDDAKKKLRFMRPLLSKSEGEDIDKTLESSNLLFNFFEQQSRKLVLSISFPTKQEPHGTRIGSKRWRLSDGVKKINLTKTITKFGVNIPLITTRTDRIITSIKASTFEKTPRDLIVSIDCSDSTGKPCGKMNTAADFEIVLFFSLINLAQKIGQRVGLTLWSDRIHFSTLPQTCRDAQAEDLKKKWVGQFGGSDTRIGLALQQARDHQDKAFFLLTDGGVKKEELTTAPNVWFFLVRSSPEHLKMFMEKYGEEQVTAVEDLKNLPSIAISKWLHNFGTSEV